MRREAEIKRLSEQGYKHDLIVEVIGCRGLPIKGGTPFVSLVLLGQKHKTKPKTGNSPTWKGATFVLYGFLAPSLRLISFSSLIGVDEHAELEVVCLNNKMVGDPEFLGEAFFSIAKIRQLTQAYQPWYPLRTETSSQVRLY